MDIFPLNQHGGASITYTGTAGVTTTFSNCKGVLVWATTDCYIRVGVGVTATSADMAFPANTPVTIADPDGGVVPFRVSAIQISAGGTIYAKPVAGS